MPLTKEEAQKTTEKIINFVKKRFYNSKTPVVFGMELTPLIEIEAGQLPNGNLTPIDNKAGMIVSQGLLDIENDLTVKFTLGHELGHAFSETILTNIGLKGIGGSATEVIADLTSAYVLSELGNKSSNIIKSLENWKDSKIFDEHKSGDHPEGEKRLKYVRTLFELMSEKAFNRSFEASAKLICNNL